MNFSAKKSNGTSWTNSDITVLEQTTQQYQERFQNAINTTRITVESGIEQLKMLIAAKKKQQEQQPVSLTDLWLQLRFIEQTDSDTLIRRLRSRQLCQQNNLQDDENFQIHFPELNRTKSRIFHCFMSSTSDRFQDLTQSYAGVMLFSFKRQLNFSINQKYCRRGDIFINKISSLNLHQSGRRFVYDNLLRLNFSHEADKGLVAIGFYCADGRCQFDIISSDQSQRFLPDEYQIFDMFLLTHWFNNHPLSISYESMKSQAFLLLVQQYQRTRQWLTERCQDPNIIDRWKSITSSGPETFFSSIENYLKSIANEIEILRKRLDQ